MAFSFKGTYDPVYQFLFKLGLLLKTTLPNSVVHDTYRDFESGHRQASSP